MYRQTGIQETVWIYFLPERFAVQARQTRAVSNRTSGWRCMYNLNFLQGHFRNEMCKQLEQKT